MRRLVALALERLIAHVESLPRQPSADVAGAAELARSLRESLPEQGAPYEELLALLFERAVPKSFNTAGPGYLAYIPGGGLFHAGVADLIADVTNRFVDALAEAVAADRAAGLRPFFLVVSAGTTNTGAVDDITAAAEFAQAQGLWLHVDAAYGGFFVLTERGRRALRGMERADSITLDPHKGLFLPYGTGSVLVRDAGALRRAHSVHAEYLPPVPEDPDFVDYSSVSPGLSRDFRGLRVWLPIKMHGIGAFRRALDEKLDLAAWAADELRRIPGVEIVAEPHLSLLAFRIVRPGLDDAAVDDLNRRGVGAADPRPRRHNTGPDGPRRLLF